MATVLFRRREETLMAACRTAAESDACYRRRCLPRKARLDRLYARRGSLALDLAIIAMTLASLFGADRRGPLNRTVIMMALRRTSAIPNRRTAA